ncbi:type IV pilin protein [Solimicrobium silvestre]|uniref:Prepilin-type N-terminal cleavage/methylation domain n=1 Tax=Solimicrobium silvestre TaxID=2099400 RepID=A0A2S9GTI4_9BURK|nr:type IV pilin protein [Solimicrobium silvestre]PRC91023.1 Prepilin-type N-terminal cleavage/methylation domain [Solimicrobium silvestre]
MKYLSKLKFSDHVGKDRQAGFTLIELMVVIVIIGILVAVAVPAYNTSVQKSHRTDAKTALLDLASREEKFYSLNNEYSQTASDLYGSSVTAFPKAQSGTTAYYSLSVTATTTTFKAIASIITTTQQNGDPCGDFTISNTGVTANQDASENAITGLSCW